MALFINHIKQINVMLLTLAGASQPAEDWLGSSGVEFPDLVRKRFKIGKFRRFRGVRNFSATCFRA